MSDARWADVDDDVASAVQHFGNAVALYEEGGFHEPGLAGYRNMMALLHAMQAAHTSTEAALRRVLAILDEEQPSGESWHEAIIQRLAKPMSGQHSRPPMLSAAVAADLHETRRFRHRASHSYSDFDPSRRRHPSRRRLGRGTVFLKSWPLFAPSSMTMRERKLRRHQATP